MVPPVSSSPVLSQRELTVVRGIADGKTFREIAGDMSLSYETVRTYAASIRRKLDVKSRSAIAVWAVRNGKV